MINVFTDLTGVKENLTDSKFCLVDDISKADVIFIRQHYKDYKYILKSFVIYFECTKNN